MVDKLKTKVSKFVDTDINTSNIFEAKIYAI